MKHITLFQALYALIALVALGGCRKHKPTLGGAPADGGELTTSTMGAGCGISGVIEPIAVATAEERLWVLTRGGALVSFTDRLEGGQRELDGETVVAIREARDRSLWALTFTEHGSRVQRHVGVGWEVVQDFPRSFGAKTFSEIQGRPVVALGGELVSYSADGRRLSHPLPPGERVRIEATDAGAVYVGLDEGEWGGGLWRLRFEQADAIDLSKSGVIDSRRDPVTSLAVEGDCVYAAVALVHGPPRGRVVRVCGERIETVFENSRGLVATEPMRDLLVHHGVFALGDDTVNRVGPPHNSMRQENKIERCGLKLARHGPILVLSAQSPPTQSDETTTAHLARPP